MNNELDNELLSDPTEIGNPSLVIDSDIDSSFSYSEQLETIIQYQEQQISMMAQNNINQLFVIGAFSSVIVLVLLYFAIKKFL